MLCTEKTKKFIIEFGETLTQGCINAFKHWCRQRKEYNPRYCTLRVWLNYQESIPPEYDKDLLAEVIWDNLGQF